MVICVNGALTSHAQERAGGQTQSRVPGAECRVPSAGCRVSGAIGRLPAATAYPGRGCAARFTLGGEISFPAFVSGR
jgi:hypothetical protein